MCGGLWKRTTDATATTWQGPEDPQTRRSETDQQPGGSAEGFPPRRGAAPTGEPGVARGVEAPGTLPQDEREYTVRRDTVRRNPPGARDSSRLATAGGSWRLPNAVTRGHYCTQKARPQAPAAANTPLKGPCNPH